MPSLDSDALPVSTLAAIPFRIGGHQKHRNVESESLNHDAARHTHTQTHICTRVRRASLSAFGGDFVTANQPTGSFPALRALGLAVTPPLLHCCLIFLSVHMQPSPSRTRTSSTSSCSTITTSIPIVITTITPPVPSVCVSSALTPSSSSISSVCFI